VAGVGAPAFRTLLVLGYRDPGAPFVKDQDKDGIPDDHDACIDQPEDMDRFEDENGCPDPDNDHDGIPDIGDTCPDDPEDIDGYADGDGCADPDNDQDGVLDGDDQCPTENGLAEMHGCPDDDRDGLVNAQDECPSDKGPVELGGCPDRDNDRVPDKRDKCPDEPADSRIDPKRSDGCPAAIFITPTEIHIPEIYFDTNKSTIQSRSFDLVHQIAEVLKANPDLRLIEIAGHTDSTGNDASNLKLSQGRADAVRSRLVTIEGIDASRLVAVGYGETQPIESNRTPEGRAMNRRVEFRIKDPPPQ
jgi:outer membrane protein OmpA-like peptidoglycan-associated protein